MGFDNGSSAGNVSVSMRMPSSKWTLRCRRRVDALVGWNWYWDLRRKRLRFCLTMGFDNGKSKFWGRKRLAFFFVSYCAGNVSFSAWYIGNWYCESGGNVSVCLDCCPVIGIRYWQWVRIAPETSPYQLNSSMVELFLFFPLIKARPGGPWGTM